MAASDFSISLKSKKHVPLFNLVLFSILTLLCTAAFAKATDKKTDAKPKPNQTMNYTVYSDGYPQERLDGPVNASGQGDPVLPPGQRDMYLSRAGLTKYVASWDHLGKDLLILRASKNSFSALRSKYPKLPPASLQHLQKLLTAKK